TSSVRSRNGTMDEDDELMTRIQSGDGAAFTLLVERHFEGLRNFLRVRSHSIRAREMSEDLAQEVLLRVYNEAWDFVPQGKFKAWMYRIARNLLIDTMRRHSYDALIGGRAGGDSDDQLGGLAANANTVSEQAGHRALG